MTRLYCPKEHQILCKIDDLFQAYHRIQYFNFNCRFSEGTAAFLKAVRTAQTPLAAFDRLSFLVESNPFPHNLLICCLSNCAQVYRAIDSDSDKNNRQFELETVAISRIITIAFILLSFKRCKCVWCFWL